MAATTYLCFSPSFSLSSLSSHKSQKVTFSILPIRKPQSRIRTRILACEKKGIDLLGDFGARDPFPAEIESNFCENILGNTNTEHKILIPNASALSLSQQDCAPISPNQPPMSDFEARQMLFKVSFLYIPLWLMNSGLVLGYKFNFPIGLLDLNWSPIRFELVTYW